MTEVEYLEAKLERAKRRERMDAECAPCSCCGTMPKRITHSDCSMNPGSASISCSSCGIEVTVRCMPNHAYVGDTEENEALRRWNTIMVQR